MPIHNLHPEQREMANHLAARFATEHPEDASALLATVASMIHWGAAQDAEHGFAFFTLTKAEVALPIICAGVFPAAMLHEEHITPEVFDTVIAALQAAKAEALATMARKQAAHDN